jgi:DNA-binding transcriptional MerR regulator
MFGIGDFARHGCVSVRMLRHYDAIGLLRPAHVDPVTGYRYYRAGQLAELNRIVALKDLGFTLDAVGRILADRVGADELHGMLRLRRAELAASIEADTTRLRRVEERLRSVDAEGRWAAVEVQVKALPAVRVVELTAVAAGFGPEEITPVIRPLYADLGERLARAAATPIGPALAYYTDAPDGGVVVHAALPVAAPVPGLTVVDLPAVPRAATIVHKGDIADVLPTYAALARWIEADGARPAGPARELYLESAPEHCEAWVTELQEPIEVAA